MPGQKCMLMNEQVCAGDLRQCDPKASCVSSSAIRSPSQYMPAWDFAPTERDHALAAVVSTVRELELDGQAQLLETNPERGYVKARLRYDLKGMITLSTSCENVLVIHCPCDTGMNVIVMLSMGNMLDAPAGFAGRPDWDLLEIWLRKDQIALFRMESDMALPNPPGCFLRNCINGPRTRAHASAFQARLGWPSLETDEDKGWKPLFLH